MANTKQNCWEFTKCGREPGGNQVAELGICPAASTNDYAGLNGGEGAGRVCWAAVGTFNEGEIVCHYAERLRNCVLCPFFKAVERQEAGTFTKHPHLLRADV